MALYRATPKLINRIMTGRIPLRAFVVGNDDGRVPTADNAIPGSPGVTGHIAGLEFKDLIDPSTGSFSMPAALAPVSESITNPHTAAQPTVRCELQSAHIHETGQGPLPGGPIFMNRYFEADFPAGTASVTSYLVQNGWFAAAGALTNAGVPAALNVNLPVLNSRNGSRAGVY